MEIKTPNGIGVLQTRRYRVTGYHNFDGEPHNVGGDPDDVGHPASGRGAL